MKINQNLYVLLLFCLYSCSSPLEPICEDDIKKFLLMKTDGSDFVSVYLKERNLTNPDSLFANAKLSDGTLTEMDIDYNGIDHTIFRFPNLHSDCKDNNCEIIVNYIGDVRSDTLRITINQRSIDCEESVFEQKFLGYNTLGIVESLTFSNIDGEIFYILKAD